METNLSIYLSVLKRRFWVILLLLAATMAVILGRVALTPTAYRSSMTLQIIPLEPEGVALYTRLATESLSDSVDFVYFDFSSFLRSTRMAQRTLADTGVEMTASEFVENISVERAPAGDLMSASVTAASPEEAEKLLQRHVEITLQEFRANRALPAEATGAFLETELVQAEKDLESARMAVLQFKLENRMESLDRALAVEEQAIGALNAAQQTTEIEVKRLEAAITTLERQLKEAQTAGSAAEADSPAAATAAKLVQDLQQQIATRQVEIASQRAEGEAIVSILAKRQANLASLITLGDKYLALQDIAKQKLDTRDFLGAKVREARLKENQSRSMGYFQVVSAPSTPSSQLPTQTVRTALLGALLSIVAGAVLIYLLEFLERSIRSSRGAAPNA